MYVGIDNTGGRGKTFPVQYLASELLIALIPVLFKIVQGDAVLDPEYPRVFILQFHLKSILRSYAYCTGVNLQVL